MADSRDFAGRTVLVCGARFAGLAAVRALRRAAPRVLLTDQVTPDPRAGCGPSSCRS